MFLANDPTMVFQRKKVDINKLLTFGFLKKENEYCFKTQIAENQFQLIVSIDANSLVRTHVIDLSSGDEYILHRTSEAVGSFVGMVRSDVETVLQKISDECFVMDVFKTDQGKALIRYVRDIYGDELEFLWSKLPNAAIWRRKDTAKWYGTLLTVSRSKLGLDSDEIVEIINLHSTPEKVAAMVDKEKYFPGWHMNKKHWYTIILDGTIPLDVIERKINESYQLATKYNAKP